MKNPVNPVHPVQNSGLSDYDALGHRVRKIDAIAGTTTLTYNDPEWRVLAEYAPTNNQQLRKYVYGNYIDEALVLIDTYASDNSPVGTYYFLHDHLYSPAVLIGYDDENEIWIPVERYEYGAYGTRHVYDQNFGNRTNTNYGVYVAFQGHIHDRLDNGNLNLLDARYRTYDPFAGRWLMHEKLGIYEIDRKNRFKPSRQFDEGTNLYAGFASNAIKALDPLGLFTQYVCCTDCQERSLKNDERSAQAQIYALQSAIRAAISADTGQYPWFTNFKLNNALSILQRASYKLTYGVAICEKSCKAIAWAWPGGRAVHVCPAYWRIKDEAQAASLAHEGTHMGAATTDATYFWQNGRAPHDAGIIGWDIIASTYDTWILTGFCVPGFNCPASVSYNANRGNNECPANAQ
ncbi:MAG: hypothetical protein GX455_12675 [Phycisphaerae bacterium]|nr:hypothetical protein [Phycisphaerae bacterium]